jgi:hypothetical protein
VQAKGLATRSSSIRAGLRPAAGRRGPAGSEEFAMQDVLMLLFTVVFFLTAFLYVNACQKLR